jgi:excisionase family DNA binding protein
VVGLSEKTVLRRIQDERISATRIGRLWRIPVTEVGRLLG